MPLDYVGYVPWLRGKCEQMGLDDADLERLLALFPDNVLASHFRKYEGYSYFANKRGMSREQFNDLWRRGPIAALLRGERPGVEINALGDLVMEGLAMPKGEDD